MNYPNKIVKCVNISVQLGTFLNVKLHDMNTILEDCGVYFAIFMGILCTVMFGT